jgi:peptidoglycan-associated lipoprotein
MIGAAMIVLAGCSSKSTISPAANTSGGGDMSGGSGAGYNGQSNAAGLVLGDIFFNFDSSALSTEAQEQLKQNAAWLKSHAGQSATIEGHCDERGTDEYNVALGERRAVSAKQYLVTLGVGDSKLTTVSYGKERPFDPGHNEEAWAKNRRDHFVTK